MVFNALNQRTSLGVLAHGGVDLLGGACFSFFHSFVYFGFFSTVASCF